MSDNKRIYIVLSQTGTIFSRILKVLYKREYNHASVSINESMEPMYSFGRLNAYNLFYAGFVKESARWGTFKRFHKTKSKILAVDVDDESYTRIVDAISDMERNKNEYKYNYKSLFFAFFKIHKAYKNRYYCSEFIKYILEVGNVEGCDKLPDIIHPTDFLVIKHEEIYCGLLKEYKASIKEKMNF